MSYLKVGSFVYALAPFVLKSIVKRDMLVLVVENTKCSSLLRFLRDCPFLKADCLLDIWGVDYPSKRDRFEVNYMLLSTTYNFRVIVRTSVGESKGLQSVEPLFSSAGWLEREVWDMYGVLFYGNNDLRRILTDYGFEGHPLRKDFPLSGYTEVRYDDGEKRVLQEPLEVSQEFRSFSFKSPWES